MAGAVNNENNTESNDGVVVDEQQQQQGRDSTAVIAVKDDIPQECLIKHPLQNKWTLWYLEVDRTKSWEDMQNKIASFETVEDFWSLYNHIRVASELKVGNDYSLFKNNIRPMWEDKGNKRGGRWLLNLNKSHRRNELDVIWLDILLILIGEAFENSDDICGAVVNIRARQDKIAIWTADGNNKESIMAIGKKIHESLRIPSDVTMQYELHTSSLNKNAKPLYTL